QADGQHGSCTAIECLSNDIHGGVCAAAHACRQAASFIGTDGLYFAHRAPVGLVHRRYDAVYDTSQGAGAAVLVPLINAGAVFLFANGKKDTHCLYLLLAESLDDALG